MKHYRELTESQIFIAIFEEINNNPELESATDEFKRREGQYIHTLFNEDGTETPRQTLQAVIRMNKLTENYTGYETI
jgi:hypothetical protein